MELGASVGIQWHNRDCEQRDLLQPWCGEERAGQAERLPWGQRGEHCSLNCEHCEQGLTRFSCCLNVNKESGAAIESVSHTHIICTKMIRCWPVCETPAMQSLGWKGLLLEMLGLTVLRGLLQKSTRFILGGWHKREMTTTISRYSLLFGDLESVGWSRSSTSPGLKQFVTSWTLGWTLPSLMRSKEMVLSLSDCGEFTPVLEGLKRQSVWSEKVWCAPVLTL